jgi:carbon-monoxide dehydrogenase large subunit
MVHVVFVRSPIAHARIVSIDAEAALEMPGVVAIVNGAQIASVCKPWVATLAHLPGMKSAPQYPLAIEKACWQGEAVLAILAETRHEAEDAMQRVNIEWEELPVVGCSRYITRTKRRT